MASVRIVSMDWDSTEGPALGADPETASAVVVSFNRPLARVESPLAGPNAGKPEAARDNFVLGGPLRRSEHKGSRRRRKRLRREARDVGGDGPPTTDTLRLVSDPEDGAGRESTRWRTSPQTFFADGLAGLEAGARASLASDEVGHIRAARIRRRRRLVVIDGAGSRWEAELVALDRRRASCRLLAPLPPEPALPLHLWAPVAHRDRSLWLVEKVVELGAATITWIEWERSRSVADAGRSDGFLRRAEGRARAALKQSGRGWLPRLEGPLTPAEAFGRHEGAGWLADTAGRPLRGGAIARGSEEGPAGRPLTVAVGPEGGLTSPERRRCSEAGFEPVSMSRATLRFETAAVVAVASAAAMLADDENEADDEGMK